MCGTFAYINFLTEKKRSEVIDILLNGLSRLEYRGYDSAGKLETLKPEKTYPPIRYCG